MCFPALADCWVVGSCLSPSNTKIIPSLCVTNFSPNTEPAVIPAADIMLSLTLSYHQYNHRLFPLQSLSSIRLLRNLPQVNAFCFLPFAKVQTREMCVCHREAKSLKEVFFGFLQIKTVVECKEKKYYFP